MKGLSIVMATYNGDKYLKEQLDSIFNQTILPTEVLVVDDCSTDSTKDILIEYQIRYGLKYVINDRNIGVNGNFEKGLELCTCDYILFSDQDDIWFENKIEVLYNKMIEIDDGLTPCVITSSAICINNSKEHIGRIGAKYDNDNYIGTLLHHYSQGSCMILNRACMKYILPIPKIENVLYDYYIGLLIAMCGKKYDIAEPLMYYRRHDNNVVASLNEKKLGIKQRLMNYFPGNVIHSDFLPTFYAISQKREYFQSNRKRLYDLIIRISHENLLKKSISLWLIGEISIPARVKKTLQFALNLIFSKF